jgi:ATP-binding cassette subfamily B multidrug efflux pump
VRLADRILIVDQGRLAAQGTHAQLAEDSCLYAEIVASQLMPDVAREREVA